jgi:hypothetical protein
MNESQVYIAMPDAALPVLLPAGWTVINQGDPLTVMGPESDLTMFFLVRPVGSDTEQLFRLAWQQAEPEFDLLVGQTVEMPSTDGWDTVVQVSYRTPESESRIVIAIARMLDTRAYITLIDGTKAGFSRRMAHIAELNNAWKPAGLKEPSLAGISPKAFGEDEQKAMGAFVDWAMRHTVCACTGMPRRDFDRFFRFRDVRPEDRI